MNLTAIYTHTHFRKWFTTKSGEQQEYSMCESVPDINGKMAVPEDYPVCAARSIDLTESHRADLLAQISAAVEQRLGPGTVNSDNAPPAAAAEAAPRKRDTTRLWSSFVSWIARSDRVPVDIIVDGANVGYYKQNYAGAPKHIDYFQVDSMVQYLKLMGKRVLLVLHCRHLHPQTLPADCVALTERWKEEGLLYSAPAGCNDGKITHQH